MLKKYFEYDKPLRGDLVDEDHLPDEVFYQRSFMDKLLGRRKTYSPAEREKKVKVLSPRTKLALQRTLR